MKKTLDKESVIQNKKEAIKGLNKLLEYYISDPSSEHLKKADLLSYWIKEYVKYIKFEEKFDPKKNIAYKRGNIVKLNFGFNVGSEYGGLHYAIVLDNKNDRNSPVLTVIPLTSVKESKELHNNNVDLGNEIYRALKLKYDTILKQLKEEQVEILNSKAIFSVLLDLSRETFENVKQEENIEKQKIGIDKVNTMLDATDKIEKYWKEKEQHNLEQQEHLDKIGQEIARMKEGSIALVNQVTTISKMRIYDPRNLKGVLSGISLSAENMDKINEKVKELYVFS